MEGLLESQLYDIANDTLQNFMDELDQFGFIPNGGRIYCKEILLTENSHLICHRSKPLPTSYVHSGRNFQPISFASDFKIDQTLITDAGAVCTGHRRHEHLVAGYSSC
jgi:hypothetical protein